MGLEESDVDRKNRKQVCDVMTGDHISQSERGI